MVDSYKIANTISWETSLNKLEKYYDQHKKLDEEQQKQKIDILKDICRSDLVQSGYYQVLVKTMKRRIFLQPVSEIYFALKNTRTKQIQLHLENLWKNMSMVQKRKMNQKKHLSMDGILKKLILEDKYKNDLCVSLMKLFTHLHGIMQKKLHPKREFIDMNGMYIRV